MALAVLVVSGKDLDVDACLDWVSEDAIWRIGGKGRMNQPHTTSGFVITLAEDDNVQELIDEAMKAFVKLASKVDNLITAGANAVMDFGLFVSPMLMQSIELDLNKLQLLQTHRVSVTVTAYPCAD